MIYDVLIDGKSFRVELVRAGESWRCVLDGRERAISAVLCERDAISLLVEGKSYEIKRERTGAEGETHLWVGAERYAVEVRDPRVLRRRGGGKGVEDGPRKVAAQMPGKVVRVMAAEGDDVEAGQGLLVVEAMKMQNEIKSPKKGVVRKVMVAVGQNVNPGDVLAVVE